MGLLWQHDDCKSECNVEELAYRTSQVLSDLVA